MDTTPAPADQIVEPTVTSRRRGSLLLLRTAGWALAVVVVVMHVFAPAMSAGFPHLSTFGWTLSAAGYLTSFGVVARLAAVTAPAGPTRPPPRTSITRSTTAVLQRDRPDTAGGAAAASYPAGP